MTVLSNTYQRYITNVEEALKMWRKVPPEEVIKGLRTWRCGTQACFGGHLTKSKFFRMQGLRGQPGSGEPTMANSYCVPLALFGHGDLFYYRGADTAPHEWQAFEKLPWISDHTAVTLRLEWWLAQLKERLEHSSKFSG